VASGQARNAGVIRGQTKGIRRALAREDQGPGDLRRALGP
jgi:hypothetical protein